MSDDTRRRANNLATIGKAIEDVGQVRTRLLCDIDDSGLSKSDTESHLIIALALLSSAVQHLEMSKRKLPPPTFVEEQR